MTSPLKTLSRETAVYGLSTVVGRFLNFLLVPFYVNVLRTRVEFGVQTTLYAYMAFLSVVLPLGLEGAYFRYAARAEGEAPEPLRERRLFSTPFWAILSFALPAAAALFLLAPSLALPVFADRTHDLSAFFPTLVRILRFGSGILVLDALAVVPFAALRLEHRAKMFTALKLGNIVLTLVLNFFFVLRWRMGVEGIFQANLIASAATLAAVLLACGEKLAFRFDAAIFRRMLPFGLGNVPAYLGAMMVQVIDRPIVQRLKGLDQAGVYQANYRMGIAMMVLVSMFDYAWRPFFLRQHATRGDAAKPLFARVFTYSALLMMLSFLGMSFFLPWFVGVRLPFVHRSLLRSDYLSGTGVIPVVLLAYVFQGFYTNFIVGIYIREKTRWLPVATGLAAAVNIVTNLWWIPRWGILGAAAATLAAYLVMAAVLYAASQRIFPIAYEWGRVAKIFVIVLGSYVAGIWIGSAWAKTAAFAAAVALLLGTGFFDRAETEALKSMFRARRPAVSSDPVAYATERREEV
ncbi:MAG: lipopolysaccharide biosynthesis protein [Thermoanaerobaculia bacterium]